MNLKIVVLSTSLALFGAGAALADDAHHPDKKGTGKPAAKPAEKKPAPKAQGTGGGMEQKGAQAEKMGMGGDMKGMHGDKKGMHGDMKGDMKGMHHGKSGAADKK